MRSSSVRRSSVSCSNCNSVPASSSDCIAAAAADAAAAEDALPSAASCMARSSSWWVAAAATAAASLVASASCAATSCARTASSSLAVWGASDNEMGGGSSGDCIKLGSTQWQRATCHACLIDTRRPAHLSSLVNGSLHFVHTLQRLQRQASRYQVRQRKWQAGHWTRTTTTT